MNFWSINNTIGYNVADGGYMGTTSFFFILLVPVQTANREVCHMVTSCDFHSIKQRGLSTRFSFPDYSRHYTSLCVILPKKVLSLTCLPLIEANFNILWMVIASGCPWVIKVYHRGCPWHRWHPLELPTSIPRFHVQPRQPRDAWRHRISSLLLLPEPIFGDAYLDYLEKKAKRNIKQGWWNHHINPTFSWAKDSNQVSYHLGHCCGSLVLKPW